MKKTAIFLLITAICVLCLASCTRRNGTTDIGENSRTVTDYRSDGTQGSLGNAVRDVTDSAGDMIEDGIDGIQNGVNDLTK